MQVRRLGEIPDEAKGVLLAFAAAGTATPGLGGLDDGDREQCDEAWLALAELGEEERKETLCQWSSRARSGLPDGFDRLHPGWIEDALLGEPGHLLRYFCGRLPEALRPTVESMMQQQGVDPVDTSTDLGASRMIGALLDRIAFASLAPLCESACGPLATRLCALDFAELQNEATRVGARTLGRSLAGADASLRARAMALAGEPWAQLIAEGAEESLSSEQRKAALLHASANVHASARTPAERLLHVGLAALKAALAAEGAGSLFRVAGRLPPRLGRPMLEGRSAGGLRMHGRLTVGPPCD